LPGATSIMQTFGMAVAGRYVVDVAPLGVCAVDKTRPEQGFIRGVAYNVPQLNPLGINADALWINPVNAPPDTCDDLDPSWNSTSNMVDFVCTGKSLVPRSLPGPVFVNTGTQSSLERALNSRFDDPKSNCSVVTAPPDANVKEYRADNNLPPVPAGGCPVGTNNSRCGHPRDWMQPGLNTIPLQQSITIDTTNSKPVSDTKTVSGTVRPNTTTLQNYGALWSYSRERNFDTGGGDHTLCDWSTTVSPACPTTGRTTSLYGGEADQTASGYPTTAMPAAPYISPYFQTSGKYFERPPINPPGVRNRRVLNMLIIDCSVPPSQVCSGNKGLALNALAIGKFFMPVKANFPKELHLEFVGEIATLPPADIRLYK